MKIKTVEEKPMERLGASNQNYIHKGFTVTTTVTAALVFYLKSSPDLKESESGSMDIISFAEKGSGCRWGL